MNGASSHASRSTSVEKLQDTFVKSLRSGDIPTSFTLFGSKYKAVLVRQYHALYAKAGHEKEKADIFCDFSDRSRPALLIPGCRCGPTNQSDRTTVTYHHSFIALDNIANAVTSGGRRNDSVPAGSGAWGKPRRGRIRDMLKDRQVISYESDPAVVARAYDHGANLNICADEDKMAAWAAAQRQRRLSLPALAPRKANAAGGAGAGTAGDQETLSSFDGSELAAPARSTADRPPLRRAALVPEGTYACSGVGQAAAATAAAASTTWRPSAPPSPPPGCPQPSWGRSAGQAKRHGAGLPWGSGLGRGLSRLLPFRSDTPHRAAGVGKAAAAVAAAAFGSPGAGAFFDDRETMDLDDLDDEDYPVHFGSPATSNVSSGGSDGSSKGASAIVGGGSGGNGGGSIGGSGSCSCGNGGDGSSSSPAAAEVPVTRCKLELTSGGGGQSAAESPLARLELEFSDDEDEEWELDYGVGPAPEPPAPTATLPATAAASAGPTSSPPPP
ncbi:unnamed protein product, partial [Phaeothamnion confervicola]